MPELLPVTTLTEKAVNAVIEPELELEISGISLITISNFNEIRVGFAILILPFHFYFFLSIFSTS